MLYCDFVAKLWMKLHTPRLHIQRNGIYVFGCFTVLLIKLYDTTGKIIEYSGFSINVLSIYHIPIKGNGLLGVEGLW